MSIERMELVNIAGLLPDLDATIIKCCESGCFHIESAAKAALPSDGFRPLCEENPYAKPLKKLYDLANSTAMFLSGQAQDVGLRRLYAIRRSSPYRLRPVDYSSLEITKVDEFEECVDGFCDLFSTTAGRIKELDDSIRSHSEALTHVEHLKGLNISFDRLIKCEFISFRIGKLPVDSFPKLAYYDKSAFFFTPFDKDENYYWGAYYAPRTRAAAVDEIFSSLYFEPVEIPDYISGTPENAGEWLSDRIAEEKAELAACHDQLASVLSVNKHAMDMVYSKLKYMYDTFELRECAPVVDNKFYLVGFVPKSRIKDFIAGFDDIDSVSVVFRPPEEDDRFKPPIRLKNGWFSNPFSMFVEMYGLPDYNGINPTGFVALTYTLLFGIMFGDLGQGLVLALLGALVWLLKKNPLGAIIARVGVSSAFFGCIYGSVFGFEEALNPIYKMIGLEHKPIEVFDSIPTILLGSVLIGVCLLVVAIIMNIITGFKKRDYERALFSNNGIAGLLLYTSIVGGVAAQMLFKIKLFTPLYIIGLIVIPALCMFFKVPLTDLILKRPHHKESIGEFIAENFFEMFEYMLSYVTNTLSFLRVGGFILSHAGMMMVVMTLAKGTAEGISIPVVVIGNIFVMGLEGLLVGIQVLRLEFYEIFSRFYDGNGREFKPAGVDYTSEMK